MLFKIYGDGSKREVVKDYASTVLKNCNYIIFHGYKFCVNARAILGTINHQYKLGVGHRNASLTEYARRISAALTNAGWKLFVLIHNIDGPALRYFIISDHYPGCFVTPSLCLRFPAQQEALSVLSRSVYLMATVDNKHAGLMWSPVRVRAYFAEGSVICSTLIQKANDNFNWVCTELNTGLAADEEELANPSKGRRKTQGHTQISLEAIWRATTKNHHKILEALAIHATAVEDKDHTDPLTLPGLCDILK